MTGATPIATPASVGSRPVLILAQNSRSLARGCDGAPGDRNGARPVTSLIQFDGLPTTPSSIEVLLPPVEPSVYTSADFRALVIRLGMRSSMGRTGVCWDNSLAESFFSMLKNERVYRTVYATKAQARSDIIRYIEGFYNSRRRHSALGYRRPNEVHYGYQQPALAA